MLYVRARLLHWSCIIISQVASFPTLHGITGWSPDLAVLGGKRAASLQEAATSPHPLSIRQNAIKVVSRLKPVPILHGCTASHAVFAYMSVAIRRFYERTTGPRFSILADQSTLANAAVLEPCTTNKHVLNYSGKKSNTFHRIRTPRGRCSPWIYRASIWLGGCLPIIIALNIDRR